MRPRDGGLVAHGVRAMRNDDAAVVVEERVGDRRYLKFESIMGFSYNMYSTIYDYLILLTETTHFTAYYNTSARVNLPPPWICTEPRVVQ